jgi:prepilin-type N-terminal cleavage/methylation domain-containing protein
METSMSRRKASRESGFTLIEVLVAVTVLAVGLLAVAALMSQMGASTNQSRYMGIEALLASEKLEDLNQYPADPAETAGALGHLVPGGSLTADVPGYFDHVQISSGAAAEANGDVIEIKIGTDPTTGGANYTIVSHSPNGQTLSQTALGTPPTPSVDMLTFDRRWQIVQGVPTAGVRQITVLITLANAGAGHSATFQTTMVRP